jgi:hypothetical protein
VFHHGRGLVGRRTWSGYSVLRRSRPELFAAYGDPCYVAYGRPCGYRFYAGRGYSRAFYGRGHYPWPSRVRGSRCLALEDLGDVSVPDAPAIPTTVGEAHEAHFDGDFAGAATAFRLAVESDATDGAAWIGLAHASFGTKQWGECARALRRAAELGAIDPEQRLDVEASHGDPKAFHDRMSALRARVRWHILDDDARLCLAYFEAGLGETEEAKADLAAVLRRSSGDACALALLGRPIPRPDAALALAKE